MRRPPLDTRLLPACAVAVVVGLWAAPSAGASLIAPAYGGSPNANHIHSLYVIVLVFAIVFFLAVEGGLAYTLWRFRARKDAVAAQIGGNTRLELTWAVGVTLVVVTLATITFTQLGSIRNPPNSGPAGLQLGDSVQYATSERQLPPNGRSLNILVNGQQYIWRFTYPGGINPNGLDRPYSYEEMVVPTNTTITLDISAQDVVHSWWIPALGGKFDAVPGYTNHTWMRIDRPGVFRGQCAFLCGRGHARMIAVVRAVPPAQFEAWLAQRRSDLVAAEAAATASRLKLQVQTGAATVQNP